VEEPTAATVDFGARLRELRVSRGMSLGTLAARVHYSKGHLSNVERGHKVPSDLLARLCDGVLAGGGVLIGHPAVSREAAPEPVVADWPPTLFDSAWTLLMAPDGSGSWDAGGEAHTLPRPLRSGRPRLDEQWALFDAVRGFGRAASPSLVLPMALVQFQTVRAAVKGSVGVARRQQMLLGARLAEYLGWMSQEAGDDNAALAWTDTAVRLASAADEGGSSPAHASPARDLSEYVAARRALVMLYRREAAQVIALTERVAPDASPRVRWLTALRQAQGHALAGDHASCLRALDRAEALSEEAGTCDEQAVLGPATPIDRIAAVRGWCLYDLGRPAEAVAALEPAVAAMPRHTREYPRFGARLALAYAAAGDLATACRLMADLLETVVRVDSATIRTDLRTFGQFMERHHLDPVVAPLRQRFTAALHR
jgi:hypothetical protein